MCLTYVFLLTFFVSLTSAYFPIDAYGCDCSFGFLCSGGGCPNYQPILDDEPIVQKPKEEEDLTTGMTPSKALFGKCCRKCWDGSSCCLCGRCAGC